MSDLWIVTYLTPSVINFLSSFSLIIVGWMVERNFVSRPSIFANTVAVNLHSLTIATPDVWIIWYTNVGFFVGALAIIACAANQSLGKWFYTVGWFYCSIAAGLFVLFVH